MQVLYVNQEIEPYITQSHMATMGNRLPQRAQEHGYTARAFMPKFGIINERRNQLHEVIRLSGLNLVVAGEDHPLVIKVASLQALRMQVYFIDNQDFFLRRGIFRDELGQPYADNDQRALFFAKGVLETVIRLRWIPDIIHCNGWFSSFVPALIRTMYLNNAVLSKAKIIFSLYSDMEEEDPTSDNPEAILKGLRLSDEAKEDALMGSHIGLQRIAMRYSDAITQSERNVNPELISFAEACKAPFHDTRTLDNLGNVYNQVVNAQ